MAQTTDHLAPALDHQIRWPVVVGLVAVGLGFLVLAACLDGYWQSLFMGLGTTLFLIAFVFFAEQRLVKVVERASGPTTLAEAQRHLQDLIQSARQRGDGGGTPTTIEQARADAVRRIAIQLGRAGLRQQSPGASESVISMADEVGLRVWWDVSWSGGSLQHRIWLEARKPGDGPQIASEPRPLSNGELTADDQRHLSEFELEVFEHLRTLVRTLSKHA